MNFLYRTWAEIDLSALKKNFKAFKAAVGDCALMPVVKANAYGHYADIVAPVLQQLGADAFAVSNLEEALELRRYGITTPILILGYTPVSCVEELVNNRITQCVYSFDYATALSSHAKAANATVDIHIKLDTGMGRIGFDCRDKRLCGIQEAIEAAKLSGLSFKGIFTHFSSSDRSPDEDDGYTDRQFSLFNKAVERFRQAGLVPELCHCCNSAALCLDKDKHMDLCRPGIILYGLTPADGLSLPFELQPVMTLKSVVSMVKDISVGDTVSYGRTFKATKPMRVATVTAGYADGYPRALSNCGEVLIHGVRAPIIGRVCMDQLTVDVSHIPDISIGDEVILFGKELPVEELARLCGTINYEIVCGISPRVPRKVIE